MRSRAAAFVGGLEEEAAFGDRGGCGVAGELAFAGGDEGVHRGGFFQRESGLGSEFDVELFQRFEAFGAVEGEEFLEVDGDRGAGLAFDLEGEGESRGDFEAEAHHGFVNRADLFDIEAAVGEAFAAEEHEFGEDAEDDAIGDEGELGGEIFVSGGAAFEEGEAVGVEEVAGARRHGEAGVAAAGVDGAEEGEELGPGAVAVVHGVGVAFVVDAEAFEEAVDGVEAGVEGGIWGQAAIFGVEEEDGAHE